jgi:hypothetical protein
VKKETVAAALARDDQIIPVCVGCTSMLEFCGMVERVNERLINPRQPGFYSVLYEIKPPHTLADCQKLIGRRHKGNAGERWGELP